ncbi:MAG: SIMPL domain-containing protein [Chloroflexota bacterium]
METKPDTIHISASQSDEVKATHADLLVTVKGASFFSGDEALKKSKEVGQLVSGLSGIGLPMEDIRLHSISTEASGGAILKSSSATYRLNIRCNRLEQFPDLLGVIAIQKNASLERITWRYPDEEAREQLLERAIAVAGVRARSVAASLGVELLGVYNFTENYIDEEGPFRPTEIAFAQGKSRAVGVVPQADLGMDIQHRKRVEVRLDIEYRVSGFTIQ